MLTPADLVTLPKGQAFALLEGGQLWKLRMPLPDPGRDVEMPASLQAIATAMTRHYTTGEHGWREAPLLPPAQSAPADPPSADLPQAPESA